MALISCPECKKKISETAKVCPNCGFNIKKNKIKDKIKQNKNLMIIIVIILLLLLLIIFSSKSKNQDLTKQEENITTTSYVSSEDNEYEEEKYDGIVYELDSLENSKKNADLFISAMNEYISNDDYFDDELLQYFKTTNENGHTFYAYVGKDGLKISLIFNNSTGKFHCITIFAEEDANKYYLQFNIVRKAAMYVGGVYDKCKENNFTCYLAMTGIASDYKTKYDYYEIELYVPDYTEPTFTFMSTIN